MDRIAEDGFISSFTGMQKEVHENAKKHGWWKFPRKFGELIALVHSELSEALEAYREVGDSIGKTYYSGEEKKPEGVPSELADVVIRVMDISERYGIDLASMIVEKHEFNKKREYRHGGKAI